MSEELIAFTIHGNDLAAIAVVALTVIVLARIYFIERPLIIRLTEQKKDEKVGEDTHTMAPFPFGPPGFPYPPQQTEAPIPPPTPPPPVPPAPEDADTHTWPQQQRDE